MFSAKCALSNFNVEKFTISAFNKDSLSKIEKVSEINQCQDFIILMLPQRSFKSQYKEFTLNLQLNDSNVLEIQALGPTVSYSYAIDKAQIIEHSQFFNIVEDPAQLYQLFKTRINGVRFEGGKLIVPYGNERKNGEISILLFRDPAFYKKAAQDQGRQIAQLFKIVSQLTGKVDSIGKLDAKITELTEKDQRFDQKQEKLAKMMAEQEGKIISGLQSVQAKYVHLTTIISNLNMTDVQIQEQIRSLTTIKEDKIFQNWIKDRLTEIRKQINDRTQPLFTKINQFEINHQTVHKNLLEINEKCLENYHQNYLQIKQIKQILAKFQLNGNRQTNRPGNNTCEWIECLQQNGQQHNNFFDEFTIIREQNGLIAGKGSDGAGKYQVLGRVGKDKKAVKFQKRYAHHTTFYKGQIRDKFIEGSWSQNSNQLDTTTNTFKIYKKA